VQGWYSLLADDAICNAMGWDAYAASPMAMNLKDSLRLLTFRDAQFPVFGI
jgi:hypothetical protein